jgi:hypothetical protein
MWSSPALDQRLQPCFVEAEARSDEVGVESGCARGGDQFSQVGPSQRFAAREVRVQHAEFAGLLEDAGPLFGGKFLLRARQFQRIGAIDAMQRATMRDFGDEGERVGNHESADSCRKKLGGEVHVHDDVIPIGKASQPPDVPQVIHGGLTAMLL